VRYEALSYVWGSQEDTVVIKIDEQSFRVTRNLYSALVHLRDRSVQRVLWVDAICINQMDSAERSQQVMLMGTLYRSANQVNIWLGPKDGNSVSDFASVCSGAIHHDIICHDHDLLF
jgi:hypothetical protein